MKFIYSVVRNFRNLRPDLKVEWDPGINLVLGRNGSGKTNLLESLSILSGWGAFGKTSNVITWGSELPRAFAGAEVSGEGREKFTVSADVSSRISLRLDGKAITSTDLRLSLPSILFLTSSINLIDGSPSSRRLFIDRLCSLFYPPYAKRLSEFRYILRNRITLLRQGKSPDRTLIPFCQLGGYIMDARRETLSQLIGLIPPGRFSMSFMPVLKVSGEEYLRESLRRNYGRELRAFRPLDGPNYDDVAITVDSDGRPASEALSRGQKRRLILYIIITAGKMTALKLKRNPVLLFDDLTAELDSEGREFVYQELVKTKWQVFITAPEKPFASRKKFGGIDFDERRKVTLVF